MNNSPTSTASSATPNPPAHATPQWARDAVLEIYGITFTANCEPLIEAKAAVIAAHARRELASSAARVAELEKALKESQALGVPALVEIPESKNPSLWRYFQNAHEKNITYHTIGVDRMEDGGFHFYIHPQSVSGDTQDYLVWPDPFNWTDLLVNRLDSPPPDVEKFKAMLENEFPSKSALTAQPKPEQKP